MVPCLKVDIYLKVLIIHKWTFHKQHERGNERARVGNFSDLNYYQASEIDGKSQP